MSHNSLKLVGSADAALEAVEAREEFSTKDLLSRIDEVTERFVRGAEAGSSHKELFGLYTELQRVLSSSSADVLALRDRAAMVAAQCEVLDASASLPAKSVIDVTYKLALWRHDYHRSQDEVWPRGDIVAASVLEDLITLTGEVEARFTEAEDED